MRTPEVRDELVAALEEALRLHRRLVDDARDQDVPVTELVAQVSVLERLDDRRDKLINDLRRVASAGTRAARPGPSIREIVLDTLAELRWPQNAGFLEEYLWANRELQLDSRAFAPLRRDERRAWERSSGARDAYVVPALDPDGFPIPRWLTSSAWDLERRVVTSAQTERLYDLQKILSLAGRPGSAEAQAREPRRSMITLLAKYASEILGTDPPPVEAALDEISTWRTRIREQAMTLIADIRRNDDPARRQIARHLAPLPEHDRFWGREKSPDSKRSG